MIRVNGSPITKESFPNNETKYIGLKKLIDRDNDSTLIELIFEGNEDLFDLMMIKKFIDDIRYDSVVILSMYFCPYGQMDREIGNTLFSFKYFAKFINDLKFTAVDIKDPHSSVVAAAIDRCHINYKMEGVNSYNYDLMFYIDQGGCKKYSEVYNFPYRFGNKKRNLDTGEIVSYEIIADKKDIKGKKILVRDDLVVGGRSFKEAAKALKEMGAKQIDLYITHIMPSAEDFCKNYKEYGIDNFYSANTLEVDFYNGNKDKLV